MKTVLKYFPQGLVYVAPVFVTIYVLVKAFILLDNILPLNIPGLGLLLIFAFVTGIGMVARHLISDKLVEVFELHLKGPLSQYYLHGCKGLDAGLCREEKRL
ncbi:MAG: hypothetical protein U5L96_19750 [Owenweeksia sp.]|nr:hypothetical protein [Owenweeksia sp.]